MKIDETAPGIQEGKIAGGVTVGVVFSGNAVGKTPAELAALSAAKVDDLRQHATKLRSGSGL
ncbi:hypothetical protein [Polycladidibacter hongkongensis]|uniref:hypothetical protein n=1 Tax=Polycladidibacter hongkongensis TaxID=1647556 RepID=UPI00082B36E1|nr:hypothetical protein [Pseudovibrio hongkongensis]